MFEEKVYTVVSSIKNFKHTMVNNPEWAGLWAIWRMPGRVAIYGWSLEEVILEELGDVRCRDWCGVGGVLLATEYMLGWARLYEVIWGMLGRVAIYGWSLEEVILEQLGDVRCRDWCGVGGVLLAHLNTLAKYIYTNTRVLDLQIILCGYEYLLFMNILILLCIKLILICNHI